MDLFQLQTLGTASWLGLHSILLFLAPGLTLSSLIRQTRDLTELETYLSTTLSILTLSLALLNITHSGLLSRFLASQDTSADTSSSSTGSAPADPSSNPTKRNLLLANTLLTSLLALTSYTTSNKVTSNGVGTQRVQAFNTTPLFIEMFVSVVLTALGGGLLLFGVGAGSDVKGRSHALFDTPEHRREVKERHAAGKKGR